MQFEKRAVRLGDIRPSEQNPREDFGDIGALARSIEATGGEPLNPPVVVADGNVFRIVDGERRYRALSSLYGEDREVSALVADSMDEANELVAMLATDDKRQLTEAERARGVQQMLVLGVDEQRIERASRATAGQIRAARKLRGRIDAGVQVTLEQLEAASAFDDEKDVEAVLAAGDGWAGKADSIRRRNEREEAKAEDYDAFGDAGIPVVKERPEGTSYVDWIHLGLADAKLKRMDVAPGTVAVADSVGWYLYAPDDGAEPEKSEEEILAEQEAAREVSVLKDLYRRLVGFVASGAFGMPENLMVRVRAARANPVAYFGAMGSDSYLKNEERFGRVRDEFMERLGPSRPSEYEAGYWSWVRRRKWHSSVTAISATMPRAGSSTGICSARRASSPAGTTGGFWRGCRRVSRRRRMSSEDENYVTVTVEARGHECSILCREAMVATVGADGEPGTSLHVGTFDSKSIRVLAEAALSELLSAGVRAGIPMDAMRIELVYAAVHCGFPEEEERSAIYYDLDIDMDRETAKEEKDE